MKKILVLGAGASGLYTAVLAKTRIKSCEVDVFEMNQKAGRKLRATGNGRCNILNADLNPSFYNDPDFVTKIMGKDPVTNLKNILEDMGIPLRQEGDLFFPLTNSANAVADFLYEKARKLGVNFIFSKSGLEDFSSNKYDYMVICSGGIASPKFGSGLNVFQGFLKTNGIAVNEFVPILCPLKTKENVRCLNGMRHKCEIKFLVDEKELYREKGEVLFKKDGISGIAVFNISRLYQENKKRDCQAEIDLLPGISEDNLLGSLKKANDEFGVLGICGFIEKAYIDFFLKKPQISINNHLKPEQILQIKQCLKHLKLHILSSYSFEESEVSRGGISTKELNSNLSLKKIPNVFCAGECIDVDGKCGGYNLAWALCTADVITRALTQIN